MTQSATSHPSDCIAAHYKIVPVKIADKLAIKIIGDKKWRVCFILLVSSLVLTFHCWMDFCTVSPAWLDL